MIWLHSHTNARCQIIYILAFNVCGSVHMGNICFIRIQLDVKYSFFLKSF
jgi:hypothetical protein